MGSDSGTVMPLWTAAKTGTRLSLLAAMSSHDDHVAALNAPGPFGWTPLVFAIVHDVSIPPDQAWEKTQEKETGTKSQFRSAEEAEYYRHRSDRIQLMLDSGAVIPRLCTPAAIEAFGLPAMIRNASRANRDHDYNARAAAWVWLSEIAEIKKEPQPKVSTWLGTEQFAVIAKAMDAPPWKGWSRRSAVLEAIATKEERRKDAGYAE